MYIYIQSTHTLCYMFVCTQRSITFCRDIYVHTLLECSYTHISKVKGRRRSMSPKGDDNDNRPLPFITKEYDDVSMDEKTFAYLHTYTSNPHLRHIYHKRWVVTMHITRRYLTAPLSSYWAFSMHQLGYLTMRPDDGFFWIYLYAYI
jgi:hypothetical protein